MTNTADRTQDHRTAFRLAFDLLNRNWPSENTVEYWEKTGDDFCAVFEEHRDNPLAVKLIEAVFAYLEAEARKGGAEP